MVMNFKNTKSRRLLLSLFIFLSRTRIGEPNSSESLKKYSRKLVLQNRVILGVSVGKYCTDGTTKNI